MTLFITSAVRNSLRHDALCHDVYRYSCCAWEIVDFSLGCSCLAKHCWNVMLLLTFIILFEIEKSNCVITAEILALKRFPRITWWSTGTYQFPAVTQRWEFCLLILKLKICHDSFKLSCRDQSDSMSSFRAGCRWPITYWPYFSSLIGWCFHSFVNVMMNCEFEKKWNMWICVPLLNKQNAN